MAKHERCVICSGRMESIQHQQLTMCKYTARALKHNGTDLIINALVLTSARNENLCLPQTPSYNNNNKTPNMRINLQKTAFWASFISNVIFRVQLERNENSEFVPFFPFIIHVKSGENSGNMFANYAAGQFCSMRGSIRLFSSHTNRTFLFPFNYSCFHLMNWPEMKQIFWSTVFVTNI